MASRSLPAPLPLDLFAPREGELLLMLLDNTPPAYVSLKEGSWVSRVCLAEEGALYQRPVGWTHEDRAPPSTDPGVKVPYNTGIPDAVPPFGTVDTAAWRTLYDELWKDWDGKYDLLLLSNCGLRIYDVRTALPRARERLRLRLGRLSWLLFVPAYVFCLPFVSVNLVLTFLSFPAYVLELALFGLLRLPTAPCCGASCNAPLPHIGAEARNAAHVARRTAVLDGFAKTHGLVISYESVEHTTWNTTINSDGTAYSRWERQTSPVLRLRRAVGGGPPAGLLPDAAPSGAQPANSV